MAENKKQNNILVQLRCPLLSLSLSLSHTRTHWHTHRDTHTHTHTHTLSLSHTLSLTYTRSVNLLKVHTKTLHGRPWEAPIHHDDVIEFVVFIAEIVIYFLRVRLPVCLFTFFVLSHWYLSQVALAPQCPFRLSPFWDCLCFRLCAGRLVLWISRSRRGIHRRRSETAVFSASVFFIFHFFLGGLGESRRTDSEE